MKRIIKLVLFLILILQFVFPASVSAQNYRFEVTVMEVEAYVEDDLGNRLCYSAKTDGGKEIAFIFARHGNARVSILRNKKLVTVMSVRMTQF